MQEMLSNLSPDMIFSLWVILLILMVFVFCFWGYFFIKGITTLSYDGKDQTLKIKRRIDKSK